VRIPRTKHALVSLSPPRRRRVHVVGQFLRLLRVSGQSPEVLTLDSPSAADRFGGFYLS
jgi:hypothetical protein